MARPLLLSLLLVSCAATPPASPAAPSRPPSAASPASPATATPPVRRVPAEVDQAIAAVDPSLAERDVRTLASFGTRHTLSDTTSTTRGIGAARAWLKAELERVPGLTVSFDAHPLAADGKRVPRAIELVNVMAVLPGAMPEATARRYYVVGHFDSRVADVMDATSDAPGANDDASGVTVVLEAARVLAAHRHDATLVFLATAGEEQGLYGAQLHAKAARAAGLDVRAVLNDDIVGDPSGPSGTKHTGAIRVFSEGVPQGADVGEVRKLAAESDSPSRELARYVAEVAVAHALAVQPSLVFRADRFLRGGDHLPFNEAGYPAVRFTTVEETYARQHTPADVPSAVDPKYLADVARLNVAALAHLANAPRPPDDTRIVTAELGNDVLLRWSPCPEPDVAGYEIVWRATTSPTWDHAKDVGKTTEARMAMSKDDFFYGVRAYDRDGYASPVAFAKAAPK